MNIERELDRRGYRAGRDLYAAALREGKHDRPSAKLRAAWAAATKILSPADERKAIARIVRGVYGSDAGPDTIEAGIAKLAEVLDTLPDEERQSLLFSKNPSKTTEAVLERSKRLLPRATLSTKVSKIDKSGTSTAPPPRPWRPSPPGSDDGNGSEGVYDGPDEQYFSRSNDSWIGPDDQGGEAIRRMLHRQPRFPEPSAPSESAEGDGDFEGDDDDITDMGVRLDALGEILPPMDEERDELGDFDPNYEPDDLDDKPEDLERRLAALDAAVPRASPGYQWDFEFEDVIDHQAIENALDDYMRTADNVLQYNPDVAVPLDVTTMPEDPYVPDPEEAAADDDLAYVRGLFNPVLPKPPGWERARYLNDGILTEDLGAELDNYVDYRPAEIYEDEPDDGVVDYSDIFDEEDNDPYGPGALEPTPFEVNNSPLPDRTPRPELGDEKRSAPLPVALAMPVGEPALGPEIIELPEEDFVPYEEDPNNEF